MSTRFTTLTPLFLVATPVLAEPPQVVTDILPVHSLVATVMGDLGSPDLILPPGASPHDFSMRPSQAAALEKADVVFWIGEGLTPWMTRPIETLSGDANVIELLDQEGTIRHAYDEDGHDDHADHDGHNDEEHADHDDHDHDKEETAAAHDDHDDHDEHGDEDHAAHDDHDEHGDEDHAAHDDHDDHGHGAFDPHAWLDPQNAQVWVQIIAATLSKADPENAATYQANADAAVVDLSALSDRMTAHIAPLKDVEFAVFHDAYVYIEERFEIAPAMSVLDHEAQQPGPQRIAELQSNISENGVKIAFSEPQFDPRMINVVFEGLDVTTCEIDPLGGEFEAGSDHYFLSLERLAQILGTCGQ